MPFVQVHVAREVSATARRRLGFALAKAYGEHMQTDYRIVNVGFLPYAKGALARYDATGDEPREMTVVTCDVRTGRTPQMYEELGHAISTACSREFGVPEARIAVYLTEHPGYQIYRDGGRAPDWSAAEGDTG